MARPRDPNARKFEQIGFRPTQREYLSLWRPTGNVTEQMDELLERCMKMFPEGPDRFGHTPKKKPARPMPSNLRAFVASEGMSKAEAEEMIQLIRERREECKRQ